MNDNDPIEEQIVQRVREWFRRNAPLVRGRAANQDVNVVDDARITVRIQTGPAGFLLDIHEEQSRTVQGTPESVVGSQR